MDERDITIRNVTYGQFVVLGRAPSAAEGAHAANWPIPELRAAWRRLHEQHALVLNPATDEIRMANPFSAVPSAYRVSAGGRRWYANCAWDAFGICAALNVDGRIETSCPDCGDAIDVAVRECKPDRDDLLFHCLVPASRWWNDIIYT